MIKPTVEERLDKIEKMCCILAVKIIGMEGDNDKIDDLYEMIKELENVRR